MFLQMMFSVYSHNLCLVSTVVSTYTTDIWMSTADVWAGSGRREWSRSRPSTRFLEVQAQFTLAFSPAACGKVCQRFPGICSVFSHSNAGCCHSSEIDVKHQLIDLIHKKINSWWSLHKKNASNWCLVSTTLDIYILLVIGLCMTTNSSDI